MARRVGGFTSSRRVGILYSVSAGGNSIEGESLSYLPPSLPMVEYFWVVVRLVPTRRTSTPCCDARDHRPAKKLSDFDNLL